MEDKKMSYREIHNSLVRIYNDICTIHNKVNDIPLEGEIQEVLQKLHTVSDCAFGAAIAEEAREHRQ